MSQENNISELDELRRDWYRQVLATVERLNNELDGLSRDLVSNKDDLRVYIQKADSELEKRIGNRFEDLLEKILDIKSSFSDKEKDDRVGRRWLIGLFVVVALSLITSFGGYLITLSVVETRVDSINEKVNMVSSWTDQHHDKVENAYTTSEANKYLLEALIKPLSKDYKNEK